MSATMARQAGSVQVEQSDMRLALNMATMAKGGISSAAIEETHYLIKKPRTEVREEKMRGVEFLGHKKVRAAMKDTQLCFAKTTQRDAFLAIMAPQRICSLTGDTKQQVHLHLTEVDSQLQN